MVNGLGMEAPPHNQIYEALKDVGSEIIKLANESCEKSREQLQRDGPGAVISFDGSWEHRRKAQRCLVAVCHQQRKTVIDYRIVGNCYPENAEEYCEIPQNMEVHALRLMMKKLRELPEITAYVHDNDAKTRKLFKLSIQNLTEFLDPGHAMKSFERILREAGKVLDDIAASLRSFMRKLLLMTNWTVERKKAAWRNVALHHMGNHTFCEFPHRHVDPWSKAQDANAMNCLTEFLKASEWILERCTNEWSTQFNESLNRTKSKYASKDVKWWWSFEARMACAILDRNRPFWKMELHARLGLPPMHPGVELQIIARENQRLLYKAHSAIADGETKAVFIRRVRARRAKKQVDPLQKLDYKVNPWLCRYPTGMAKKNGTRHPAPVFHQ
jgi:hypothetical protein